METDCTDSCGSLSRRRYSKDRETFHTLLQSEETNRPLHLLQNVVQNLQSTGYRLFQTNIRAIPYNSKHTYKINVMGLMKILNILI